MTRMLGAPAATCRPRTKCDHGQRRKMVAELLLSEIFQGKLRAGQHLVIKDLSQRFQVSSTPIREALVQLEGTGIIDFAPNCGRCCASVINRRCRRSLPSTTGA